MKIHLKRYITLWSKNKEKFDEFRDNYFDINNQEIIYGMSLETIRNNYSHHKSMTVKDFFYNKTWEELKNTLKNITPPDLMKFKKHYQKNLIRLFETLIDDKFINFKFRKELWTYVETGL